MRVSFLCPLSYHYDAKKQKLRPGKQAFNDFIIEVVNLPFGEGDDHPEGMTWFLEDGLDMGTLLIVNDATANPLIGRKIGNHGFKADLLA